jgi:hypothetical protein
MHEIRSNALSSEEPDCRSSRHGPIILVNHIEHQVRPVATAGLVMRPLVAWHINEPCPGSAVVRAQRTAATVLEPRRGPRVVVCARRE